MAFSGSTIEPVISHSRTNVNPASAVSASGSRPAIVACWSMNSAAGPVTWTGNGAPSARIVHQCAGLLADGVARGFGVQAQVFEPRYRACAS